MMEDENVFERDTEKKTQRIDELISEIHKLKAKLAEATKFQFVPPGHFYSAIPDLNEAAHTFDKVISQEKLSNPELIYGIDLQTDYQLLLLDLFEQYYQELPFSDEKKPGLRYYYKNPAYSYSDAIFLFCMLRHVKPKKIIEVGSGFSSCAILDTNELFFNNSIECTFIEPYPQLLESLIKPEEKNQVRIFSSMVQDVPLEIFRQLEANDVLFIDSTHVSKFNSDVNFIIHEILPNLNDGVYIHFHDIFYPFEYPKEWILGGRAWSEIYILRAFLEFNSKFKIVLFNTYLEMVFEKALRARFPLLFKNPGGSIWIKKEG